MGILPDGRVVFVPFTLPGEIVDLEVAELKGRFARGKLLGVRKASPKRLPAPCPHFGVCGGCHYQMLSLPDQLQLKAGIVREQLQRLGGFASTYDFKITASEKPLAYRNQVQFHPLPSGKLGLIGADEVQAFPVERCLLPLEGIQQTWPLLELGEGHDLSRISFREDSRGEILTLLEGQQAEPPELETDLAISLAYKAKGVPGVYMLAGEDALLYRAHGKEFLVSPESFFQINLNVAESMLTHVLSLLPEGEISEILELYSGVGFFSKFLAERCRHLVAIEASASACYDFVDNLREANNVELYEGPVEGLLPSLAKQLARPQLVLLDPPRSGLKPDARKALLSMAPQQVIYISCDPSSLARDLKIFTAAGYSVDHVHAFDMFPQTCHVETVVLMSRKE